MNGEIQNQTTNWEALDEINLEILQILQVEGNISNADLSRRVGLTPPSVLQRVRKLEQSGYIQGYHAALNPLTFGFGLTVFVQVSLSLFTPGHPARVSAGFSGLSRDSGDLSRFWRVRFFAQSSHP